VDPVAPVGPAGPTSVAVVWIDPSPNFTPKAVSTRTTFATPDVSGPVTVTAPGPKTIAPPDVEMSAPVREPSTMSALSTSLPSSFTKSAFRLTPRSGPPALIVPPGATEP
jgi:hypothetical protein